VAAFEDYHIYAFVHSLPFSNIAPEGVYFLRLTIVDSSGSATLYSEPIYLCSSFANTVKLIYSHDENDFDYQFTSSNIYPSMLRVEGGMKSDGLAPGGKYTMFQDQDYNSVMLNSQPYNVEKWTFGPSYGMPNHMADLLNRIFALSDVTIDGVAYSRNEGAKLERAGDTEYPLAGWSIDLVKTENPYSYAFQTAAIPLTADTIDYTADNALLTADQTEL
jgi:hypothetical protein